MPGHLAGCGSFLIFAAFALLVVATVSVPIFRPISLLNINVDGTPIDFGVFGYCVGTTGGCSARQLGYGIPSVVSLFTQSSLYTEINNIVPKLTTALVLHPIAAGIAFLAFVIAACSERLGYLCSSLLCFLAFIASALALALDLAINIIIRQKINQYASAASSEGITISSSFGNAVWMTVAATACLLVGTFVVCFGVCSGHGRRTKAYGISDRY